MLVWSFSTVQIDCILGVLWSLWCRCLFLDRVARLCISLCSEPCRTKARRKSMSQLLFWQILQLRIATVLVRACAVGTSRPRSSAPRSFRDSVSLWNPSNLLHSWVFVTLQSFHNVDPFEYSSMLICEPEGRAWWVDSWFVCSACFLTLAVIPCRMRPQVQDVSLGFWYLKYEWHWTRSSSMILWTSVWQRLVIDLDCILLWMIPDQFIDHRRFV